MTRATSLLMFLLAVRVCPTSCASTQVPRATSRPMSHAMFETHSTVRHTGITMKPPGHDGRADRLGEVILLAVVLLLGLIGPVVFFAADVPDGAAVDYIGVPGGPFNLTRVVITLGIVAVFLRVGTAVGAWLKRRER